MVVALIPTGFEDENIMKAMDIKGYSHCGSKCFYTSTLLGRHECQTVYFDRRGAISVHYELRRMKVYPHKTEVIK